MIDSLTRSIYKKAFVDPVLNLKIIRKITPIKSTLLGLFFGLLSSYLISRQVLFFSILTLLLSGYFDTLDGAIARKNDQSTHFGAVLDITSDRMVEFAVIFGLFLVNPVQRAFFSLMMLGAVMLCVTTFLVVGIFSENNTEKSFNYSVGLMERAEAFLFWILMLVFPELFSVLAISFTILVLYTALYRIYEFSRQNKPVPKS